MLIKFALYIFFLTSFTIHVSADEKFYAISLESGDIKKSLSIIDDTTLVLIKEGVMLAPKSNMFRKVSPYNNFENEIAFEAKEISFYKKPLFTLVTKRRLMLIEPGWPDLINQIKSKTPLVFGIVNMNQKHYFMIPNYQDWIYRVFNQFKLNFVEKLNNQDSFVIMNAPDRNDAIFYKGIVFTGDFNICKVVTNLLQKAPSIKKVLFIADDQDELNRISECLQYTNTDYYSLRYSGIDNIPGRPDPDVVKLQQDVLVSDDKWLEDEEAAQYLQSIKK